MNRKEFVQSLMAIGVMGAFKPLYILSSTLPEDGVLMPALFIGPGTPINAIEENEFTRNWVKLGKEIPKPKAVLCISAHWLTKGTFITAMNSPRTIHDFSGFGQELYNVQYPAKGNPELANEARELITHSDIELYYEWGLDHGTWSIVNQLYPDADIPVIQLSIDYKKDHQYHYDLAKQIYSLRKNGVLIIGSGNLIYNTRIADPSQGFAADENGIYPEYAFDWAVEFNEKLKLIFQNGNFQEAVDYKKMGKLGKLAHPTPDHYYPLLYTLSVVKAGEAISIFNDKCFVGSLSMTSVKFG